MAFLKSLWISAKSLFCIIAGSGKKPEALTLDSEAVAAVFLPLAGLVVGFTAVVASGLFQLLGLFTVSIIAGLAVLVVLGGLKQFNSVAMLFSSEGRAAGAAVIAVLVLLLEFFALYETGSMQGYPSMFTMILYLPVTGALAMVAAASVSHAEDGKSIPLSGVKGLHMVLCCVLTFVLMLPQYGMLSLLYVAASVLAGSVVALILNRKADREESIYVAAAAAEILYLIVFLLVNRPHIYY